MKELILVNIVYLWNCEHSVITVQMRLMFLMFSVK